MTTFKMHRPQQGKFIPDSTYLKNFSLAIVNYERNRIDETKPKGKGNNH